MPEVKREEDYPKPNGPDGDVNIEQAGCWSTTPGCKGIFKVGPLNRDTSWRINHGTTGGRENFTLRAGQTHSVAAQYQDTFASAWGLDGVPEGQAGAPMFLVP
jgi:hypothetical protein